MKELPKMSPKSLDDFSFPIISNFMIPHPPPPPSSSLLWRVSSRVYHHDQEDEEEEEGRGGERIMEVRSMCEEGYSPTMSRREMSVDCVSCYGDEWGEMEERMDYLWEDFNHIEEEERESKRVHKEICIVKKQRSSKMGTRPSTTSKSTSRSSSILVVGKLLKGLMSIKRSAQLKIMKAKV